jgi:uncharacterized RDD family membrane protein YckC
MIYAGFWKRFVAYLIDNTLVFVITFLVFYFFLGFDQSLKDFIDSDHGLEARIEFYPERNIVRDTSLILWLIYSIVMEASALKGTIGKRVLKISVVDKNGDRISFNRSIGRNTSKILSIIPFFLGLLWVAFTKEKKGWHDMIAKTYVVKGR